MKRKLPFSVATITLICMLTLFVMPQGKAFAEIADGTYTVDYQILKAEDDSVSMANDYFEKPATLSVENGVKYIQFTLNHSEWIKELQSPSGGSFVDVNVISEDKSADKRVVKFKVDEDLSKPLEMKMYVHIDSMDPVYDHRYTVRYDFDIDNMKQIGSTETKKENKSDDENAVGATSDNSDDTNTKKEANPPTGDNVSITMFVILLVASSLVIFSTWKSGFDRN